MSLMTVAELIPGDSFRVVAVTLSGETGKRLVEMGFCQGVEGIVVRRAPLGDPIQVEILGYQVSLRVSEAKGIIAEKGA